MRISVTPKKFVSSVAWGVVRCIALSALVSAQQTPQSQRAAQAADAVAAHVKVAGLVRSSAGVPVPGATVNLVHTQTGQSWVTWTDEKGKFELPGSPIGHYKYEVEQLGFDKANSEA